MKRSGFLVLALGGMAAAALAAGCARTETANIPSDALISNESFVAIARPDSPASGSVRTAASGSVIGVSGSGSNDFYIAVSKRELGQRWFLSGYLRQYYPGDGVPADLAVRSLGARVVSFAVQNGKLFVFDVADGHQTSDVFDPQVLVEAYPLVTDYAPFQALANHDGYVLFDPAAGLNKFQVADDLYTDSYLGGSSGPNFEVGLSFMQNFRKISDGVTYEQIFSGNGLYDPGDGHPVSYHTSGTVSVGLRKYKESKNYAPTPYPQTGSFYFTSDYKLVPGGATVTAIHFPISRDMDKPITFYITKDIQVFDKMYPNAHLVDAVKEGIENWNDVFGFRALQAKLAGDGDDIGQADKNFIIIDTDASAGYAFANWRSNPNTGEILGANVYVSGIWFASNPFADNTAAPGSDNLTPGVMAAPKPKTVSIAWSPMMTQAGCAYWAPKYRSSFKPTDATTTTGTGATDGELTPDQKFHNYITHVVLHEVGHTLGLRHNFEGSLLPPSSSVMDYLVDSDSVAMSHPGDYDAAAIGYLYGVTDQEPDMPFCTDDGVSVDPNCATFDSGADPFHDYHAPYLDKLIQLEFKYGWGQNFILDYVFNYYINDSLGFAVAGPSPDVALEAYDRALGKAIAATATASPNYAATVDGITHTVLARLYLDPASSRGYIADLPQYPEVNSAAVTDLGAALANDASVFTFDTRRAAVDILKLMQSEEAFNALRAARDAVARSESQLSPQEQALTDDLLARIDRATSPYFDN